MLKEVSDTEPPDRPTISRTNTDLRSRRSHPPSRRRISVGFERRGEHFTANDPILSRRRFLDRAQKILLDLYPLWLFATSDNVKDEYELYNENIHSLARPLTRAAG